jgi:hypothetical protein
VPAQPVPTSSGADTDTDTDKKELGFQQKKQPAAPLGKLGQTNALVARPDSSFPTFRLLTVWIIRIKTSHNQRQNASAIKKTPHPDTDTQRTTA